MSYISCVPDIAAGAFILKTRQHIENQIIVSTRSITSQTSLTRTSVR